MILKVYSSVRKHMPEFRINLGACQREIQYVLQLADERILGHGGSI